MMRCSNMLGAIVVAILAVPAAAVADGMAVQPGMWEVRYSLPDPLGGESGTQVYRTCVRDRTVTAQSVMARVKDCRIWNASFQGPLVRWKMRCETAAGPMTGSGSLRSTGSAFAGAMQMTMAIGALEIPVTGAFKGRRTGECR